MSPGQAPLARDDLEVPLVSAGTIRYANLDNAASTSAPAAVHRRWMSARLGGLVRRAPLVRRGPLGGG